jgi:hypothetical protein
VHSSLSKGPQEYRGTLQGKEGNKPNILMLKLLGKITEDVLGTISMEN